jgi:hypothetical protein
MMDRRAILAAVLAGAVIPASASGAQSGPSVEDSCELNADFSNVPQAVTQICNAVSDQLTDRSTRLFYQHRKLFFGYSRASNLRDPGDHIAKKVQHFWATYNQSLVCNQLGFTIPSGSLLKLAIERDSRQFINDVARRWNLWLNGLDQTGETVLDFVDAEIERGGALVGQMRTYRDILTRSGAKRAAELTPSDQPIDPFEVELRPLLRTWDRACYFNEGLAAVKRGGLWGYVNAQEQEVVPPRYDGAFAFSQGRAAVNRGGRWGYIDLTGREVIPLRYADALVFVGDGSAEVTVDGRTWTRIGLDGA